MVDLAYIVISKLAIFRSDIRRWLYRNPVDQTWQDFQDVFTTAHQELRETEASVGEIGFQSANAIISQMVNQVVTELRAKIPQREPPVEQEPPENPPVTNPPLVLAIGTPAPDTNMIAMLTTIQANIYAMCLQMETANMHAHNNYGG